MGGGGMKRGRIEESRVGDPGGGGGLEGHKMTQRNLRWGWKGLRREVALGRLRARGEVLPSVGGGLDIFPYIFP